MCYNQAKNMYHQNCMLSKDYTGLTSFKELSFLGTTNGFASSPAPSLGKNGRTRAKTRTFPRSSWTRLCILDKRELTVLGQKIQKPCNTNAAKQPNILSYLRLSTCPSRICASNPATCSALAVLTEVVL